MPIVLICERHRPCHHAPVDDQADQERPWLGGQSHSVGKEPVQRFQAGLLVM